MHSCGYLLDHNYCNFSKIQFLDSNDGQVHFYICEDLIFEYELKVAHSDELGFLYGVVWHFEHWLWSQLMQY